MTKGLSRLFYNIVETKQTLLPRYNIWEKGRRTLWKVKKQYAEKVIPIKTNLSKTVRRI